MKKQVRSTSLFNGKRLFSIIFFLFTFFTVKAQTTLSAGDIAVVRMNQSTIDGFSLVLLKPITTGTTFWVTEQGWRGAALKWATSSEAHIKFIAPVAYNAGTVLHFDKNGTSVDVRVNKGAEIASTLTPAFNFAGGDQVIVYQGTLASPAFIAAFQNNDSGELSINGYTADAVTKWASENAALDVGDKLSGGQTSRIPTGLTNGVNALSLYYLPDAPEPAVSNSYYTGSLSGTAAEILARINTASNWSNSTSDVPRTSIGDIRGVFSVAVPAVSLSSSPTITFTNSIGINTKVTDGTAGSANITDLDLEIFAGNKTTGALLSGTNMIWGDASWFASLTGFTGVTPVFSADQNLGADALIIKSSSPANNFALNSLSVIDWGGSNTVLIEAYDGGISKGTVELSLPLDGSSVIANRTSPLTSMFNNIDEVRIYAKSGGKVWVGVNNINVGPSPTQSAPVATATPASQSICSDNTTNIALTSNPIGASFAWTVATASGTVNGASAGSGTSIAQTLTGNGVANYTVTPTLGGVSGTPITVAITVKPKATATATPSSQAINSGSTTSIALTSTPTGATFAWSVSTTGTVSGAVAGAGSSIAQTLTGVGTATYTVTPTLNGCPGTPTTASITVNAVSIPTMTITSDMALLSTGETANITFTFSTAPLGFTVADIVISGGTLSGLAATANPLVYTATFEPTAGIMQNASITVANGSYTNTLGTPGTGYSTQIAVNTVDPIPPANTLAFNALNQYAEVPARPALDFTTGTLEMWVKPGWTAGALNNDNPCIAAMRSPGSSRWSFHINRDLKSIGLYAGTVWMPIPYTFAKDQWYHIAMVMTPTTTTIYIDGTPIGNTGNAIAATLNNKTFKIGKSEDANAELFKGEIDEVRIWNTARNITQIADNRSKSIDPNSPNLIGYYKIDADILGGTNAVQYQLKDYSAATAHGNIYNYFRPTLATNTATDIQLTKLTSGGNISSNGGGAISARGLVYSSGNPIPTLADRVLTIAGNNVIFSGEISGLLPNTTYSVRSYATNTVGTSYGNLTTVKTLATPAIVVNAATLPGPKVGVAYSQTLTASGGTAPYTFSVSAGSLPNGLTINTNGELTGTPKAGGPFNFTITATDANAYTGSRAYSFTSGMADITLAPTTLAGATKGTEYNQTFTASLGTAPYTYTLTGTLPAGLTFSPTGVISGTPTEMGTFLFGISVKDSSTGTGPFFYSDVYIFQVNAPAIVLSPSSISNPKVGVAYTPTNITASGGTAPYTYAVTSGALPGGLTLSAAGVISGTPKAAGSFNFTVTATDTFGSTGAQAYSVASTTPTLAITPQTFPNATVGTTYGQTITPSGGTAPYIYTVASGVPPTGLVFNTATGTLSGTPTAPGTFVFNIRITDSSTGTGAPFSLATPYLIAVSAPSIGLSPGGLSAATVGVSYAPTVISASGGVLPYSYAVSSGALPTGMTLSALGVLSGTSKAGGTFNFTITATDLYGSKGSSPYSLVSNAPVLTFNTASFPNATTLSAYSQTISASGGTTPYDYSIGSGALPTGLTLDNATGVISGTPTLTGTFNFSIRITDSSTGSGPYNTTSNYSITVGKTAQLINLAATANAIYGDADITPGASASSALPVIYGSGTPAVVSIVNNKIHILKTGIAIIYADQPGDNTFAAAPRVQQELNIAPAALTITANGPLKPYGTALTTTTGTTNFTATAAKNGEVVTSVTLTPDANGLSALTNAGQTYVVTPSAATGTGGFLAANYSISYVPFTGTVAKIAQNIAFVAPAAVTYGANDITLNGSASSALSVSYTSSNPAVATIIGNTLKVIGAGTTTITARQAGDVNYNAATDIPVSFTVNPKGLTIANTSRNKVYGQALSATDFTGTISGLENCDNITATRSSAGSAANVAAGTYPIAAALNDPNNKLGNYTVTNPTGTLTVTAKGLTIANTSRNKVYGQALSATDFTGTISGLENGDNITATRSSAGSAANVAAGTYPIAAALNDPDNKLSNYTVSNPTGTLTVTAKGLTIANTSRNKVYGQALSATDFAGTISGLENGDNITATRSSTGSAADVAVGTYPIAAALNDPDNKLGNYTVTNPTGTLTVTAKGLTIANTSRNKVYGQAFSATDFAGTISGLENGDNITATRSSTGSAATVAVGTYPIAAALNDPNNKLGNYTVSNPTGTLTVTAKGLIITADNKERFEGTGNPVLTVSYSEFANGETEAILTIKPTISTTASTASIAGNYPITATGAAGSNYNISYVDGILKVKAGAPTSVTLAAVTLFENRPAGTNAGTLNSTSDDPTAKFTYTLVAGAGDTDNALFSITDNKINTTASLNYENKAVYRVRVRSTTQYNLWTERDLSITITDVNEIPTLAAIADQTICYTTATQSVPLTGISAGPELNQNTTLTASSNNANLFTTLAANGSGSTGTLTYRIKSGVVGTAVVTLTVTDNGGTANGGVDTYSRTFVITVNALPVVAISSNKGAEISKGERAELTATGGVSYEWVANGSIEKGEKTAVLTVRPRETTTYTVTATNASGCKDTQTFTLTVLDDLLTIKATNILTPNGDGVNDKWVIDNIDFYPNNEVKIFDKAGRLLYAKKGYDNSWDGTFNGAALQEGTYYYIIDFGTTRRNFKGFITIIRPQ